MHHRQFNRTAHRWCILTADKKICIKSKQASKFDASSQRWLSGVKGLSHVYNLLLHTRCYEQHRFLLSAARSSLSIQIVRRAFIPQQSATTRLSTDAELYRRSKLRPIMRLLYERSRLRSLAFNSFMISGIRSLAWTLRASPVVRGLRGRNIGAGFSIQEIIRFLVVVGWIIRNWEQQRL